MCQGAMKDEVDEAILTCPVSCIHWVTAPQLTLLEEMMGKMERVDSWLLMRQGGKGANLNVFFEASLLWAKRQSKLREAEQRAKWAWMPGGPAAGSTVTSDSSDDDDMPPQGNRSGGARRQHATASMVNAARKWRDFQQRKRQKSAEILFLTDG